MKNETKIESVKKTLDLAELEQVQGAGLGWIRWDNIVNTQEIEDDLNTLKEAAHLALSIFK